MSHLSENSQRLKTKISYIVDLTNLWKGRNSTSAVYLLRFPSGRTDEDAAASTGIFQELAEQCNDLDEQAVVCVLTTPPDAARLQPLLESVLQLQLWVAVKSPWSLEKMHPGQLPNSHAALLIFTRYRSTLKHTKTRVAYTHCPGCGKTTKDYGGKKHTYHNYGTLLSDVWRDITCDPERDIDAIIVRLADMFGIKPYSALEVIDLTKCQALQPKHSAQSSKRWVSIGTSHRQENALKSRLINQDCLAVLRNIRDETIDFCFADPPYNLRKRYEGYNDALEIKEYFTWCDQWLAELARVLKPGCTCAILNIPLWAIRHFSYLSTVLEYQAWIAWEGMSLPVRMIMPSHYTILCFTKGQARSLPGLSRAASQNPREASYLQALKENFCTRSGCIAERRKHGLNDRTPITDLWWDIHRLKHNSYRVDHPCQLPPLLMRRLFAMFTHPGEIILDCFNGAGTSSLVAQEMGRRFIGIELSAKYHNLAKERHEELTSGLDPFRKRRVIPKVKNSRVKRLPQQRYEVPKRTLQLDVKRIAGNLGRLPTREEVRSLSRYPFEYFERYFIGWGEVCAAARTTGMSELPAARASEQLLLDKAAEKKPTYRVAMRVKRSNRPVVLLR